MTRPRPHRVGKAESLFVANLKPFSTASVKMRKTRREHYVFRFATVVASRAMNSPAISMPYFQCARAYSISLARARMTRSSAATSRRRAIASAV